MAEYSQDVVDKARSFDRSTAALKTRVHALAKALGLSSKEMIAALGHAGIVVKSAASTINQNQLDAVLNFIGDNAQTDTAEADDIDAPPSETAEAVLGDGSAQPEDNQEASESEPEANQLHDVEPPITPEPEVASPEQVTYAPLFLAPEPSTAPEPEDDSEDDGETARAQEQQAEGDNQRQPRPRRRRRGRGRGREEASKSAAGSQRHRDDAEDVERPERVVDADAGENAASDADAATAETSAQDQVDQVEEPQAIKGSTRLEAQRRRRNERRIESRKRHVISEAEFLARRESVERTMVVRERNRRDHPGIVTEVGVLEDDLLVEHFVTSDTQSTQIGNIYLGRVQNVLPSMEAAFIDIGTGRNGVIYVADLNWKLMGIKSRGRRIEQALKAGDQILVQVSKDPIGHKGARLTTHISLAGRFLVYVPGGRNAGISRKLPEPERRRLKEILAEVTPEGSGTIIRTAAEGVSKEAIAADVARLEQQWQDIFEASEKAKAKRGAQPITLYQEPDMLVKVVRDVFNEDFTRLVVDGERPWHTVTDYVSQVAPELESRLQRYNPKANGQVDAFEHFRIDEQLAKALDRKVWLPSGGTLVIDRTEAMTVIDVNTGKFTGAGGNLEETVTRNNLEAAEEIVRQMRLRDLGGMIVVDFIDMVLPENQDLVLRRLKEALGRDRSRHEVSEVTSLGLVQMTRKRLGTGLLESFSTPCSCCNGRGLIVHFDPVEQEEHGGSTSQSRHDGGNEADPAKKRRKAKKQRNPEQHPAALAMHRQAEAEAAPADTAAQADTEEAVATSSEERVAAAVDAVVVAAESKEPKPPRRRRARKRVHSVDNTAAGESDSPDAGEEKLAAVVAAAVAQARQEDPEEPSDDRYVAAATKAPRPRRIKRRRKSEPTHVEAAGAEERDATAGGSAAAKRDARADVAEQQVDSAAAEKTYEQAVAEFENSPRRRRPTRGKSRSDRAPRREDFQQEAPAEKPAAPREQGSDRDAASKPERAQESQSAGSNGRRRRALRRALSQREAAEAVGRGDATAPVRAQQRSQQPQDSTRGRRRRVVRRSTRAS